ncbi:hypothetical protein X771_11470 [Mesorhizobium sp. LSJC277A00]|nr:hypothetical protein X771_11470 [Mesorhizobium sp. LSJC277A00]
MICSSEKRLRFMSRSSTMGQNELQTGLDQRGKVTGHPGITVSAEVTFSVCSMLRKTQVAGISPDPGSGVGDIVFRQEASDLIRVA